jgi:hypothetical protein
MPRTARPNDAEPVWPAILAVLAIAGLHYALPSYLSPGPDWLLLAIVAPLLLPAMFLNRNGRHSHDQRLGIVTLAVIAADLVASLVLLVSGLPSRRESPRDLLLSAAGLWVSNILLFASWYWRLDAGGPHQRALRGAHTEGAFLFPQMTLSRQVLAETGQKEWQPGFVDYLFLAFNTNTSFSPSDISVLSRWAKIMMMVQAMISLGTLVLLAARAVNIL